MIKTNSQQKSINWKSRPLEQQLQITITLTCLDLGKCSISEDVFKFHKEKLNARDNVFSFIFFLKSIFYFFSVTNNNMFKS